MSTTTITTTAVRFRYIGTTDDVVTCEKCNKPNLRNTVVLMILDEDGNDTEVTYYGSTCAARALGVRGGGRAVLASARNAAYATRQAAADSRRQLDAYGLPHTGAATDAQTEAAVLLYADAHRHATWAPQRTALGWYLDVLKMHQRHQAVLTEAALIGG
jgi:hypothetical protein